LWNRKGGRAEAVRCGGEPAKSRLEDGDVEVDEQTDAQLGEPQVRHDLSHVNGQEALDSLQLPQDPALDDEIEPVPAVEVQPLVFHRKRLLPAEP
jgi:hypothetical protein